MLFRNIKIISYRVFLFILFSMLFHIQVNAQQSFVFNVVGQPPLNTKNHNGFMDEITREALKRIGTKLIINRQPAERGLRSINKGIIDGEMSRVEGIEKKYPNLIRVPEKIMVWDFVVFSKKKINLDKGWIDLENKNTSFINGWKILEKNVPQTARITKTKNSEQLFKLLNKGRTDFVIYEHWGGRYILDDLGLETIKVRLPALASKDMYIYLHKKHAKLVPRLSEALAAMKKDGTYNKIKNKYLKDSFAGN